MISENSLITFRAISNFVICLAEVFGKQKKYRPLQLYAFLINKTTLIHEEAILKHISAFKNFCIENREAIINKSHTDFVSYLSENSERHGGIIKYSDRVWIDIGSILKSCDKSGDKETKNIIWKHILTISALVDPAGKAKDILKQNSKSGGGGSSESEFLSDVINKVEKNIDPNANPMDAISNIMQSGIFTDLVSGMGNGLQDGTLDLSKLMSTVQNMVSGLSSQLENLNDNNTSSELSSITNMMSNLTSSMKDSIDSTKNNNNLNGENNNQLPDLSVMMNMVGPLLQNLTNNSALNNINNINNNNNILNKKSSNLITDIDD